jgi:glycosyltransferase involved in cell wall biosynthesis
LRLAPSRSVGVVIPAHNEGDRIASTLRAVAGLPGLRRVVVIDDGSTDDTSHRARRMGALVVRMPVRRGKGAAVRRGLRLVKDCPYVLLIDADLGDTAAEAARLLRPVIAGEADVTVAGFRREASGSGLGIVKSVARTAVRIMRGVDVPSVLSGQRVLSRRSVRLLDRLDDGYGLETGMTLDLLEHGLRILEVDVAMVNRDQGRSLRGFCHRGRQLVQIVSTIGRRICCR